MAFNFIDSNPDYLIDLLHTEYVTFSEQLLNYFNKTNKGFFDNQHAFFYSDVLDHQNQGQKHLIVSK